MSDIANSRLKSGVKEKFSVGRAAPLQCGRFALLPIMELKPDPSNPRKHGREQVSAIARSIAAFGFNAPILIDRNQQIVAGHGRYEAAKLNQCAEVPVVWLEHLTETQARAYMLADNKLTDKSSWDDAALAVHLKGCPSSSSTLTSKTSDSSFRKSTFAFNHITCRALGQKNAQTVSGMPDMFQNKVILL